MLVNAKCAPHYVKTLIEQDPESPFLKTYTEAPGAVPRGPTTWGFARTVTSPPCPLPAVFGGNLKTETLADVWASSRASSSRSENARKLAGGAEPAKLNALCGGCRARAFGATGDVMAEDDRCARTRRGSSRDPPLIQCGQGGGRVRTPRSRPQRHRRSCGTTMRVSAMQKIPAFRARNGGAGG
jgi:hypothetical protein